MEIFLILIIGHFTADFLLQGETVATKKRGLNKYMLIHVTIAALAFMMPTYLMTANLLLSATMSVLVLHLGIDIVKKEVDLLTRKYSKKIFWNLIGIDQMLHVASLYFVLQTFVF